MAKEQARCQTVESEERARVSRLHQSLILMPALALILSSTFWWNARRELQVARRDLQAETSANSFLRKTLGDMTAAITAKDREIDRLERSRCAAPGSQRTRPLPAANRHGTRVHPGASSTLSHNQRRSA